MNGKMMLLLIATIMVGVVALPETLALFAKQHTWYDINRSSQYGETGVPCVKCHVDIQQQIDSPANGVHKDLKCESCHIVSQVAKGSTLGGTGTIHAAASPLCIDCHDGSVKPGGSLDPHSLPEGNCMNCHKSYTDMSTNLNATSIFYGKDEVHKKFVEGSNYSTLLKGSNEACVACHTHVSVDIVWNKPTNMTFSASRVGNDWEVTNFNKTGSKITNTTG